MSVIKVEDLSKLYRVNDSRSDMLRDAITGIFSGRKKSESIEELWALRDINFSIDEGETFGIIGKNGAGKSTLLRILSRITKPTHGFAEIKGRVGSLLEIGTGFHSELSGRENIYLNGAILGMRRTEIQRRFDEIVEFSGIGAFLDTPVKHYSSGMYMRLAFSVAAHLEPEILIIDEVLAVGDVDFQEKCLGKMDEVRKTGRTVIFVSHQMGSVAQLCRRSILLEKGRLVMDGPTDRVIEHYLNNAKAKSAAYTAADSAAHRDMFIQKASIVNDEDGKRTSFRHDEAIVIGVRCSVQRVIRGAELRTIVRNVRGAIVFITDAELNSVPDRTGTFEVEYKIPGTTLRPNGYSVDVALFVPHQHIIESVPDALFFSVYDAGTRYAQSEGTDYGLIFSPCQWTIKMEDAES